jgi:hypothetical protein
MASDGPRFERHPPSLASVLRTTDRDVRLFGAKGSALARAWKEEGPFPGLVVAARAGRYEVFVDEAARLRRMSEKARFTVEEARATGERIGIEWLTSPFEVEQFRMGMDVELEHGTQDLETNVTDDDVTVTAKIARAHLNEFPDYYTRLAVMEAEAEAYWAAQGE